MVAPFIQKIKNQTQQERGDSSFKSLQIRDGIYIGSAKQKMAQHSLNQDHEFIKSQTGLFSQGRTLQIMNPEFFKFEELEILIQRYKRILIRVDSKQLDELRFLLSRSKYYFEDYYLVMKGARSKVEEISNRIKRSYIWPEEVSYHWFDPSINQTLTSQLANFHLEMGISPIPPWFYNRNRVNQNVLILLNEYREIIGSGISATLRNAGGKWQNTVLGLGMCLHPDYRGKGLSKLLNSTVLHKSITAYDAKEVYEIVAYDNKASIKMNQLCGLSIDPEQRFLYIESER